jgi:surfeit locus 1 family protein
MKHSSFFCIFSLVLTLGCLALGTWQLHRKGEKEALLEALEKSRQGPSSPLNESRPPPFLQAVTVRGHFLKDKTIFLQAKTRQGKNGVHVLDVFQTQKGHFLLVQRGWAQTATASPPTGTLTINGVVRAPSAPTYFQPANTPPVYFWIDINALSKELKLPLLSYYIVAKTSHDPQILPTDPFPYPPNNHLQYAITWYSLALSLLCMLLYGRRRSFEKECL